ncbi:EF-hand domain-containing protein [Trichonephila inaurata madagascariensis]|uniref:EF-hand domain-containing protein n=1 Tax=Trichonephila inaurata madagascariensis TaxID=2747483 RepID=A0A8X6XX44_9ARAC|nr:EF-hand domain-containing protein [Trichonephila inaurata madagascariensis]
MAAQLQQFFKTCDLEGTRSVDREAFRDLCSRLNIAREDADVIFEDLDHDRDGRISFTDFSRGFSNFVSTADICEENSIQHQDTEIVSGNSDEVTKHHVWTTLTSEAERVGKKNRYGIIQLIVIECFSNSHLVSLPIFVRLNAFNMH